MRSDDEKKNELIADVYRADRVYEAERRSPTFRAIGEEDFEFIGKELFRKGYRKASEVAREIIDAIVEYLQKEKDIENKLGRNAVNKGDTGGYVIHQYAEGIINTLKIALSDINAVMKYK